VSRPEDLSRDELVALQGERLAASVRWVHERSEFWCRKLDEAGVDPASITSIEDLPRLPTSERAELQADQDSHPPAGSYACTERRDWLWIFTTSGTSGRPLRRVVSAHDWQIFVERSEQDSAFGPDDTVMLLGPTDGMFGPTANLHVASRAGATVIAAGRWDTRKKLAELALWRPTVLIGTASYLVRLTDVAAQTGVDLTDCGIQTVLSSGEPGASIPATRGMLEQRFGGARIVDRYGMTELPTLTRGSCPAHVGALHFNEDFVAVECLREGTTEPVPLGEPGELVFTNLVNDTQPLLRYRSRDVGRLWVGERCECGSPFARLERSVEGRVDDMIWYHGVNVFPSAIENVVHKLEGLSSDYRMVLRGPRDWPELTVEVETEALIEGEAGAALRVRVQAALQEGLQVHPAVELLAPGSLEDSDSGKTKRLLDLRETA
jgi:phenylacetate-CoA ligase